MNTHKPDCGAFTDGDLQCSCGAWRDQGSATRTEALEREEHALRATVARLERENKELSAENKALREALTQPILAEHYHE